MNEINALTLLTLIIGHPVSHSRSPVFQNAAFSHCGINSVYMTMDIEKENFGQVVSALKKIKLSGINVTVPYKTDILSFVDELKDEAKILNAVNTIEIEGDKWIGHNTDWYGVLMTLEKRKIKTDHDVLIIGAGGATNGVIYGLKQYGIKNITITNRTLEKAKAVASIFNIDVTDFEVYRKRLNDFSFIINTTTMNFNELAGSFDDDRIYYDIKYYSEVPKIKNYIDGKDMLLYQGVKSFEIWTKIKAPLAIMEKALYS